MMPFSQRNFFVSFIIATLFLLVVVIISYQNTQRFVATGRQVEHTQQAIRMLDLIQINLLKADYANRNYVITGEENNVDQYQTSVNLVTADLENLRQLTADNPNQQQKLNGLGSVIAEKLTVMGKINNFRRGNNMAEVESVRPGGTVLREDILRRLDEIKEEEKRLLNEQYAGSELIERRSELLTWVSFGVSFALLLAVFFMLNHNINQGRRVEQKREKLIKKSGTASGEVRTPQGVLVICSYCKSIRDDQNFWQGVENYISKQTEAQFSHGICPNCYEKIVKPELEEMKRRRQEGI